MCLHKVQIASGRPKAAGSSLLPITDKQETSILFVVSSCSSSTGSTGHGSAVVTGLPVTTSGTLLKTSSTPVVMSADLQPNADYRTMQPDQER